MVGWEVVDKEGGFGEWTVRRHSAGMGMVIILLNELCVFIKVKDSQLYDD